MIAFADEAHLPAKARSTTLSYFKKKDAFLSFARKMALHDAQCEFQSRCKINSRHSVCYVSYHMSGMYE